MNPYYICEYLEFLMGASGPEEVDEDYTELKESLEVAKVCMSDADFLKKWKKLDFVYASGIKTASVDYVNKVYQSNQVYQNSYRLAEEEYRRIYAIAESSYTQQFNNATTEYNECKKKSSNISTGAGSSPNSDAYQFMQSSISSAHEKKTRLIQDAYKKKTESENLLYKEKELANTVAHSTKQAQILNAQEARDRSRKDLIIKKTNPQDRDETLLKKVKRVIGFPVRIRNK